MDIHKLSYKNSISKIDKLLQKDKSILYYKTIYGQFPIHIACSIGSEKLIDLFLKYDKKILELKNDKGQTGFHLLGFYPKILENKIIEISKDFDINTVDVHGNNILITLIASNPKVDNKIIKKLKDLGASLSIPNSLLAKFLYSNNCDLNSKILEMFDYNFDSYDKNGFTPLYLMVSANKIECVKKILDKRVDISLAGSESGLDIFELALRQGSNEMIELLSQYNIDPNYTNDFGDTYLHGIFLSKKGSYKNDIIKLLLKKVNNFDIQNIDGDTIVHLLAKSNELINYIDSFNNKEISISLLNNEGKTALDYLNKKDKDIFLKSIVIKKEKKEIVKYIKLRKVNNTLFTSYTRDAYLYILAMLKKYSNLGITFCNMKNQKLPDKLIKPKSVDGVLFERFWAGFRLIYENYNGFLCSEIHWHSKDLYFVHDNFESSVQKNLDKDIVFTLVSLVNMEVNHANILLIDNNQKTIERFDPYGVLGFNDPADLDDFLEKTINKIIFKKIKKNYKYLAPKDIQRKKSFQTISRHDDILNRRIGDVGGFCLAWCFWYLENRLNNLSISPKILISKLEKKLVTDKMDMIDYIRSYANKLHLDKAKLLKKFKITPDEYYKIHPGIDKLLNLYELIFNEIKSLQ